MSSILSTACDFLVEVKGVVAPVNARSLTVREQPVDVHVVNRAALVRWLRGRPPKLEVEAVERIFDMARRSSTWSRSASGCRLGKG
ncbi:MAG: hypothetical protein M0Z69_10550 [Actinomycetota bacterium]|nr:hypothetical protein [Actinomycetota bacterium]